MTNLDVEARKTTRARRGNQALWAASPFGGLQLVVIFPKRISKAHRAAEGSSCEQPDGYTDRATHIHGVNGKQRNRGVELNAFGEIERDVRVPGGVTFIDGAQARTLKEQYDRAEAIGMPTTQFDRGSEWDLPGVMNELRSRCRPTGGALP